MDIKSQRVKGSKSQRVKKKPIPTPPYERRAEANRGGERLAARRCVIIANLLRCYRIRAWSSPPQRVALTVCPPRKTPPQAGRFFLKRGTRFKKREGRMQARRGAPSGKGRGSRPDERQTTHAPTSSTLMPARSPLIGLVKSAFTSNVRRSNCPVVFVAFQTE